MGYQWVEDGLDDGQHMLGAGQRFEIGDRTAGMQQHDMVGAAQLRQLRQQLGSNLADRYGRHQPATKNVPSQYRDSGQISINVSQTIAVSAASFTSWNDVQVSGASTVYTSFKPNRVVLSEMVVASFTASGVTAVAAAGSANAEDIMLLGAFSGSINTFPNAPTAATAIHGVSIAANAFGVGISWPTVNAGIPVTAQFLVTQTALFRVTPPTGYTLSSLSSITVTIRMAMFGPQLR